jgi:oligogalacturonide transporter
MKKNKGTVSLGEKLLFASGDMYGGGAQIIISFFYLYFLTEVVGLAIALAGTVVMISKIWDAVSDPLMGVLTDNTRSKFGRRRPYFLAGFFGIIAAFILLWNAVAFQSQALVFAYVLFSYLFYSTVQTMVMVPYAAMSSEISNDFNERTSVNGTRLFFSQFATLLCAVLPLEIVKLLPTARVGYLVMAAVFAVFFALPYILMFFFTKERVPHDDTRSKVHWKTFLEPFKVRTFRNLLGIYMCSFLAMDIVSAVFAYYMDYYLKRPGELNYVLGTMLVVQTVLVPVVVMLAKKIGKARTVIASVLVWFVGVIYMGLLQPNWPGWVIYSVAVIMGVGIVGCVVMAWTMYPDVTDVGEWVFKRRNAGSFGGIMTFMRKFSAAIGIFVVSQILALGGFVEPIKEMVDGVLVTHKFDQPLSVITALKIIVVALPLVLMALTFLFAKRYPLTRAAYDKLSIVLKKQRGESEAGLTSDEEKALREELV